MSAKNRRDGSYIRAVNNRWDTKNSRNIRNRKDVHNNRIPVTAETPSTAYNSRELRQQREKQLQGLPVSLTTAANLPPGSLKPVANHLFIRWWQIMAKIPDYLEPIDNLKKKDVTTVVANSTTRKCPNKIFKIVLFESFLHLPLVSTTPVLHLEQRIAPRIFDKNRNNAIGIV
jgi:hypothetical protein